MGDDMQSAPAANRPVKIMQLKQEKGSAECELVMDSVRFVHKQLKESGASLVSIVAVMGSYRTGKSFLLDLLLRRLHHKAAEEAKLEAEREAAGPLEAADAEPSAEPEAPAAEAHAAEAPEAEAPEEVPGGWRFDDEPTATGQLPSWVLEGDSERISEGAQGGSAAGFAWRGGQEKCTEGIWLWSTPFVFRDPSGRKVAVLLMDTQGAFDDTITKAQSSTIFGLTALLSAKLIYNIQNNLQEIILDNLDYITTYAQTACADIERNRAPFGQLEFLVRDWPNYENGFDIQQCRAQMVEHLDSHLSVEKVSEDSRPRVERLRETFESIACSGLPHPGLKVTRKDYRGDIKTIDPNFFTLLDDFTGRLFGGAFPEPSAPLGNEITVSSFERILVNFAEVFRDHTDMAISLREGFVKNELFSIRDEAMTKFNIEMRRHAPESSVLDPEVLAKKVQEIVREVEQDFKVKVKPFKMKVSEETAYTDEIMRNMVESVDRRILQNTKEVEGATVKLVASPVVGGVTYFFFCHHFILIIFAGAGAVCHMKKIQTREVRQRGGEVALMDTKVLEGVVVDVKNWGEQRFRDIQAISIALKRFNPDAAMAQLSQVTDQARTAALQAATGVAAGGNATPPAGSFGASANPPPIGSFRG